MVSHSNERTYQSLPILLVLDPLSHVLTLDYHFEEILQGYHSVVVNWLFLLRILLLGVAIRTATTVNVDHSCLLVLKLLVALLQSALARLVLILKRTLLVTRGFLAFIVAIVLVLLVLYWLGGRSFPDHRLLWLCD